MTRNSIERTAKEIRKLRAIRAKLEDVLAFGEPNCVSPDDWIVLSRLYDRLAAEERILRARLRDAGQII